MIMYRLVAIVSYIVYWFVMIAFDHKGNLVFIVSLQENRIDVIVVVLLVSYCIFMCTFFSFRPTISTIL